jgi:two-component system, sensor histidine kinase
MSSSKNNYIGDEQKTQWVEAELVGLAYNQSPAAFIGTLLNGVIITWALWEVVSHFSLVVWLITLFVITAVRALLVWRYHSAAPDADQVWAWRLLLIGGVAAAGLIWGAAGIVLFPSHSPSQVLLMFLLGGMAVAAVVVLAPVISAFFVFIVLALTPIGVQFLLQGEQLIIRRRTIRLFFDRRAKHGCPSTPCLPCGIASAAVG